MSQKIPREPSHHGSLPFDLRFKRKEENILVQTNETPSITPPENINLVTPGEWAQIATEIVNQATDRNVQIRLYGGIAVYARCPSIATHPKLQRTYADLDFIAPRSAWKVLPDLFISRGFRMKVNSPAKATFTRDSLSVDVYGTQFRDGFSFDLTSRLALDQITLPLVDLLLLKLQRANFSEKDKQDAIALLLDHSVVSNGEAGTIDRDYLYKRTNRAWGLWNTVFNNTVTLEKILDQYISLEEAQLVWRRIELLQEVLDGKPKSFGWRTHLS